MISSKVRVFVVRVKLPGQQQPSVYRESLTAVGARAQARLLAMEGHKVSVVRFDISAAELDARLRKGKRTLRMPVKRLRSSV
jgi:hypothetical protein